MSREPLSHAHAHDHSHSHSHCLPGDGACCSSCETHEIALLDKLSIRYPWLLNLTSTRVRLVLGALLFIGGLLLKPYPFPSFLVFLTGYLIVGAGVIMQAFVSMTRGKFFSEHFLMSVATIGAFIIGEYAEGFAVMFLYLIGEELEHRAVDRTRRSIDALNEIRPLVAHLEEENGVRDLSPAKIRIGDTILVYPGERVPLDGRLLDGEGSLDYSALTGESRPVKVQEGTEVMAGAINGSGLLRLSVLRDEENSAVMRIMHLAEEAGQKKTPVEMFTERFSRIYTPIVVFMAIAIALIPPLALPGQDFQTWIYRALSFLVISCPCALVISVPLAYIAGIGNASKRGVYVRGSQYMEAMTRLDTVVFDKTGTLTTGRFDIVGVSIAPGVREEELLALAASLEQHSTHPVAEAVTRYAVRTRDKGAPLFALDKVTEIAGHGMTAELDGQMLLAGNRKLMDRFGIGIVNPGTGFPSATAVHIGRDSRYMGTLYAADAPRMTAAAAISRLRRLGTQTIGLLSGDRDAAVSGIGMELGVDYMASGLLPQGKIGELENLRDLTEGMTAFVGDGINDAPVLRLADVGIAVGGLGSDAAIEAADVVIMTDELERIPDTVIVARKTKRRVYENVILILAVKGLLLALGALGMAPLWAAVFADTGVLLLAVLNSLRAYYSKV